MSVQFKLTGEEFFDSFDNEPINYTRKSVDFQKVDLTYSDFSQAFELPATTKNQGIFKHYSDITVVDGYNPFEKNDCEMWVNNELYASGALLLIRIKNEMNKPISYSVQFYSDVINLKDALADKGLSDLDWIDQRHSLTKDQALTYVSGTVVPSTNLRYPMASTSNFWSWEGTTLEHTREIRSTKDGILNRELRPSIPITDVMDRIFTASGFDYDVDFDANDYYTELYMWIHNSKEFISVPQIVKVGAGKAVKLTTIEQTIIWNNNQIDELNLYNGINGVTTIAFGGIIYTLTINLENSSNVTNIEYRWVINGTTGAWQTGATGDLVHGLGMLATGDEVYIEMKLGSDFVGAVSQSAWFEILNTSTSAVDFMEVSRYMPDMKCIDFIKGVLVLFNAVMYWDKLQSKFIIKHRSDWFNAGVEIDISEYVDITNNTLAPPTFYKTYGFEFEKGEDFRNDQYLKSVGRGYGSAFFDTGNYFGSQYKSKNPFTSNIWGEVVTRLPNGTITVSSDLAWFASIDGSFAPVDPGVRLMYYNGSHANTAGTYVVADINGNKSATATNYNLFLNNLQADSINIAFNAELDFHASGGTVVAGNLFTEFYQDYVASIYNPNVRRRTITAYIPYNQLKTIELNDTLLIDGVSYLIDSMKVNLLSSKVVFDLINKI